MRHVFGAYGNPVVKTPHLDALTGMRIPAEVKDRLPAINWFSVKGMVNGVDRLHFQGWLQDEFGYMAIPNLLIDHAVRNTHVPVGFWRGVNHNQNAVYMECFIDELAHAAGKDPYEFRRGLLEKHPRHKAVLELAAGPCTLVARATDSAGETQPATVRETWNVKGYNNNARHRVSVQVE